MKHATTTLRLPYAVNIYLIVVFKWSSFQIFGVKVLFLKHKLFLTQRAFYFPSTHLFLILNSGQSGFKVFYTIDN